MQTHINKVCNVAMERFTPEMIGMTRKQWKVVRKGKDDSWLDKYLNSEEPYDPYEWYSSITFKVSWTKVFKYLEDWHKDVGKSFKYRMQVVKSSLAEEPWVGDWMQCPKYMLEDEAWGYLRLAILLQNKDAIKEGIQELWDWKEQQTHWLGADPFART